MKVKTSFEHIAKVWDAKTKNKGNISDQYNIKAILKLVGKPKGLSIYEIACGNGYLSRKFKKAGAKEVYASDASPSLIGMAINKYNSQGIKYSVREGSDFTKLPKNHFDSIVIHQGIFYIRDIPKLMKGVHSILKPKGSIVFSVTHPLFQVLRGILGVAKFTGKKSVVEELKKYPTNFTKKVYKQWMVNGKIEKANYLAYSRPLEYYVAQCVKAGLLITNISETASMGRTKERKLLKSPMPSGFVVKAVKI